MKTRIINCIGFKEIKKPTVVIFGPTRELMAQIYKEVYNLASKSIICPFVVYGGVHLSTIVTILKKKYMFSSAHLEDLKNLLGDV